MREEAERERRRRVKMLPRGRGDGDERADAEDPSDPSDPSSGEGLLSSGDAFAPPACTSRESKTTASPARSLALAARGAAASSSAALARASSPRNAACAAAVCVRGANSVGPIAGATSWSATKTLYSGATASSPRAPWCGVSGWSGWRGACGSLTIALHS